MSKKLLKEFDEKFMSNMSNMSTLAEVFNDFDFFY